MKAYVDSSVVLRIVLKAPRALNEWTKIDQAVGSGLVQVECLRTIDRLLLIGELKADEVVRTNSAFTEAMQRVQILAITNDVLEHAGQSYGVPLKTLDAVHLATAMSGAIGYEKNSHSLPTTSRSQRLPGRWAFRSSAPSAATKTPG